MRSDDNKNLEQVDNVDILKKAQSLKEICNKFYEFEYLEFLDDGTMICQVCGEKFKYSCTFVDDFSFWKITREFSNLKAALKKYLQSIKHKKKVAEMRTAREDAKNTAVGMRVKKK